MSNNKISFKNMNNSDKVKLINNSLVLDGISLKELSKKIDIQKKDIIKFMNEEGFFFDSTDGYFKKDKEESTSIDIKPSVETSKSSLSKKSEREDVQSIIDSINEKLNIKDIETTNILLPEIKTSEKVSVAKEENLKDNTKTSQNITLEIPRVSRTARRKKKKKKTLIKRMISYLKNSFSKIFLIKKKENKPSSKMEYTNFNKKEVNIKSTNSNILEEVAIEKLPVNYKIETTSHYLNSESKLPFEIKIPKNFKGRRKIPKVDCDLDEINFLNSNDYSLEDLKKDFRDLKLNSDFIKNINSDSLESNRDKSLEERVCNLEKKINELEEFFLEIFQAMSNK
ncbi:TPA: hypothetical protein ACOTFX_000655 [Clostridium perfringens]|uniref:hypothetical protein n=1 Tax=Clostridium perfringens TaxID=1502 RepID=UPI001009AFEE|nr:hypothetical protein [Clostridium perfringens]MDG6884877.1 hypothetical protein [Clostridium perfringens]RXI80894.1 hypothetical protein C6V94_06330 [Clostridium perfringens]RXI84542.1 hypothetical protein C6V96_04575 [Clostridium perfringens]RXI86494.1 hypothetical protein C6V92_04630 [Clostridium perfringens]RXI89101.1 hypothetical protein C6V95_02560 [Clostridium perfringens]